MSRRSRIACTIMLLGLSRAPVVAQDAMPVGPPAPAAPAAKPAPPMTPEQAADAVLAAMKAKDDAALKTLAATDDPDPWLVADDLIRRAEFDAANAFARAAPRVDVEVLPGYVASRRGKPDDAARRARLAAGNEALAADKYQDAFSALGPPDSGSIDDVVGVRLAMGRGSALASLVRIKESAAAFLAAGEAAQRLGWLARAYRAFRESGASAYRGSAFAAARDVWERALSISERRGDKAAAASTLGNIGGIHYALGAYAKALSTFERALAAKENVGDTVGAAQTLGNIGVVYFALGDFAKALVTHERALAAKEALGDKAEAAATFGNVHHALGDHAKALATYERALAAKEALGDKAGVATMLFRIGIVQRALGDFAKALASEEGALAAFEGLGDRAGAAAAMVDIGNVHCALGDYANALAIYKRALAAQEALGVKAAAATTLGNIGSVHHALGDYAKALATYERALAAKEALGDRAGAALTLGNIGNVHHSLGDYSKALATHERALAAKEALGDRAGAALTLGNIGLVHNALGDHAKALVTYERALARQEASGDKAGAADTLSNIGTAYNELGDYAKALATFERVFAEQEALGDKAGAADTLGNIGTVHDNLGDHAQALASHERALAAKEVLGSKAGAALTLANMATARIRLRDWTGAIDAARRGAKLVPFLVSGLGDEQGAIARAQHARLFTVGARAAVEAHDVASVSEFMERGRAGSLLEALGARGSLQSGLVPPALAAEEAQARAKEGHASQAYRRALDGDDREATRARRRELDEAQAAVEAAVERIQREAKSAANVVHFSPDDLDVIRKRLAPDEGLILYGLVDEGPFALVVTPVGAKAVKLAASEDVEAACETLLHAIDDRKDTEAENSAVDTLHNLAVKPLGLSPETKRLLISPDGALSYVPFALLVSDRQVVYVPSGTTYGVLLKDGRARGDGVLALGDPDYQSVVDERAAGVYSRGTSGRLTRLPATADEAKAVGGTALLGKDATEKRLRETVATKSRWRAVHFACHGLIDSERPAFSSLALTADGDDDGFLTVLEVFRAKIPADLVVLSACETAKGKVVRGEGIMGLTRAFMFAGAPRVICSLWKVDDDATRALMVKFYELWNPKDGKPGLPTATALKQAQEFVRTHEKWKHPYYWAAWVLWGLPS